jgi:hypothetical protein
MEHLLRMGKWIDICGQGVGKDGGRMCSPVGNKNTNNHYTCMMLGYKVLLTKASSKHQGGIALLWQPDHKVFQIGAMRIVTPNLIAFQLVNNITSWGYSSPPTTRQGENTFGQLGKHDRQTAAQ